MAKQSTKSAPQPQPQPETVVPLMPEGEVTGETPQRNGNVFAEAQAVIHQKLATKMQLMGTVRQQLAEAVDLSRDAAANEDRLEEVSAGAGFNLYQGQADGL